MEKYEILKNLVGFNTIKNKENDKLINYVESLLKKNNFKTEIKGKNLVMSIGDECRLGFLGHMDTVEVIDGWSSKPNDLIIKDYYMYGLGVCDMKGGIAAMLDAIIETDFSKLKYGMKIYLTYDEEISFGGTYELVEKNEIFPEIMIFGEPTDNKILNGCKGLLQCDCFFKGVKVHSSTPDKGISANLNAVKFVYEMNEFYEKYIKNEMENSFEVPYTTMNVGILNGGSAKNSLPAECYVTFDFRIAKDNHIEVILKKFNELAKKYCCDIEVIDKIYPFFNNIDFAKVDGCASFMTEASLIKTNNKIILGAGPVTAHEIDEHISVESYEKLIKQYKEIINKVCGKI